MAAGRDDDTPPQSRRGRYRTQRGDVPADHVTPLPPPPVRAATPAPFMLDDGVPQERLEDETGRILLIDDPRVRVEAYENRRRARITTSPPPIVRLPEGWAWKVIGLACAGALALFGFGLELRDSIRELKGDVGRLQRAVEKLEARP